MTDATEAARRILEAPAPYPASALERDAKIVARALLSARDAALEEHIRVVCSSAWKHEGNDAYSQGMDRGAREQVQASVDALRALRAPAAPEEEAR